MQKKIIEHSYGLQHVFLVNHEQEWYLGEHFKSLLLVNSLVLLINSKLLSNNIGLLLVKLNDESNNNGNKNKFFIIFIFNKLLINSL